MRQMAAAKEQTSAETRSFEVCFVSPLRDTEAAVCREENRLGCVVWSAVTLFGDGGLAAVSGKRIDEC